jgi:hypothetical protein
MNTRPSSRGERRRASGAIGETGKKCKLAARHAIIQGFIRELLHQKKTQHSIPSYGNIEETEFEESENRKKK